MWDDSIVLIPDLLHETSPPIMQKRRLVYDVNNLTAKDSSSNEGNLDDTKQE
jgi:hypothetical protein